MVNTKKSKECFILSVVLLLIAFAHVRSEEIPSVDSVLKQIVRERESIQAGYVLVESQTQISEKSPTSVRWEVWFDGSKFRANKNSTETVCLDCYSTYTRLYYSSSQPASPDMRKGLAFYDGYDEASIRLSIPDPRWYGVPVHGIHPHVEP